MTTSITFVRASAARRKPAGRCSDTDTPVVRGLPLLRTLGAALWASLLPCVPALAADNPAGSTINGALGSPTDTVFTNEGTINTPTVYSYGIIANANGTQISNSGVINATGGHGVVANATNATINNSGSIIALGGWQRGLDLQSGSITSLVNAGLISAQGQNAIASGAVVSSFVNTGTILSTGWNALYNYSTINTFTNTGNIYSTSGGFYHYGIYNSGTIVTLNNAQGGTQPLTLSQNLPQHYNIIIRSGTDYGRLANDGGAGGVSGSMSFGVFSGSLITQKTYSMVLDGIAAARLGSTSGSYGAYQWQLVNAGGNQWNLEFTNFTTNLETQDSIKATASAVAVARGLQNALLVTRLHDYDCALFDQQGLCLSSGARAAAIGGESAITPGGVLVGAYRISPNWRLGAYLDQPLANATYSGTVQLEARDPAVGLFGVWNEQPDGQGAEIRLAAAYAQQHATLRRPVIDGISEPGTGATTLSSSALLVQSKYTFAIRPDLLLSPYLGLRYTRHALDGYSESQSSTVSTPLSYASLTSSATTALAGIGAAWQTGEANTLRAGLGVEADCLRDDDDLVARGMTGLRPVALNDDLRRERVTALIGFSHRLGRLRRVDFEINYRQGERADADTANVMLMYTAGF